MNVIAIIQARMGSSRFPSKILKPVAGIPMLEFIIKRISKSELISKVVVATTISDSDDKLITFLQNKGINHYRGSEDNVLERYYRAAVNYRADVIVRVTADDPFKDPDIIDYAIKQIVKNEGLDYCSNTIKASYPEGLDIEVFRFSALEKAFNEAELISEKEHVTPYIWKNPDIFNIKNFLYEEDLSSWRWTIDKPEDYLFIKEVVDRLLLTDNIYINYREIINFLKENPDIMEINNNTVRNEGYLKSLSEENHVTK